MHECTKFSPGLMGYWLELLLGESDVKSIEEIIVPIVPTLSLLISKFQSIIGRMFSYSALIQVLKWTKVIDTILKDVLTNTRNRIVYYIQRT